MPRPRNAVPQYLLHKPSGKARCRINGRDHYLGAYGSEESRQAYAELIRKHFSGTLSAGPSVAPADAGGVSIAELVLQYLRHAEGFYVKNGKPTSELDLIRSAVRPLVRLFGSTPAAEFGPLSLKAVRAAMIESGWVRETCNQAVNRIRRLFRYAAENELLPEDVLRRLRTLTPLMAGKTVAPDRPRRSAVSRDRIDAVLAVVPPMIRDMLIVQELTGCRPGELLMLSPDIIDRSGSVWVAMLADHKTVHHNGHARRVYIGPRAQAILTPYLSGKRTKPLFDIKRTSYTRAVTRGCEIAFGMPDRLRKPSKELDADELEDVRRQAAEWRRKHCWSPHFLRHNTGKRMREEFGGETAQAILGHEKLDMTEHYAGLTHERAIKAAEQVG